MLHLLKSVIFHGEAKQLVISAATGGIQSTRTGDKTNKDVYATPSKVLRENSDDQPKNLYIWLLVWNHGILYVFHSCYGVMS
jgi:hypothetical protein